MYPTNNKEVFEATVRELLDMGGVSVVEQEPAGLLEAVLHGEGSQESALNLIVHAHVAHLILSVFTPFEMDLWTEELNVMAPHFSQGLQKCHELLTQLPVPEVVPPIYGIGGWHTVVPREYGLGDWHGFTDYSFFQGEFSLQVLLDSMIGIVLPYEELRDKVMTESVPGHRPTTWRGLFVADVIERTVTINSNLTFEKWRHLLDLCASFIEMSNYLGSGYYLSSAEQEDGALVDTTQINYIKVPVTTKEFWAWQFGRMAALARSIEYPEFTDDLFGAWGNGVIALSLLLGSGKPLEWAGRWTGSIATCDNQMLQDDFDLPVTSHLYWLMHIGVLNAIRWLEKQSHSAAAKDEVSAPGPQALLLGSPAEIGKAIVEAQEQAEQLRLQQTTEELKKRLSQVWDMLPPDAQEHLLEAELNFIRRRFSDASLDYAIGVEVARGEWLERPNKDIRVADTFGDWTRDLREMAGPARSQNYKAQELKRRFDVRFAKGLAEAFDVLQAGRLPRAHGHQRPPLAHKAREVVLGGQSPSVFELMLRFAKRWQG